MEKKNFKYIYALGDVHQSFKPIREFENRLKNSGIIPKAEDCLLIMLGDFGGNVFFDYRDRNFKEKLGRYGFTYFVIRGNHEARVVDAINTNPDAWTKEIFGDETVFVEKTYPYIKYATDYPNIYWFNGKSVYTYPGAYSVDKYYRLKNNMFWFENEQMSEDEREIGFKNILYTPENPNIDLIISHTCPMIFQPTDLFLNSIDQSTVDNTTEIYLNNIEWVANYDLWLWGHYHATRIYPQGKKQQVMLYNEYAFDILKYFETHNPYECLI